MKAQVFIQDINGHQVGDIGVFIPSDYDWQVNGLGYSFIMVDVPEGLSVNREHLLTNLVPASAEKWTKDGEADSAVQPMTVEYWSKEGQADVFEAPMTPEVWINKNDASSVLVEPVDLENWDYYPASLNETWTYHPSVADETWTHIPAVVEHWEIVDNPVPRRNDILNGLRARREPLLKEADYKINQLEDTAQDASTWRAYRQALRDVTNTYIKVDGDPKVSVDTIDVENFSWPTKPV